MLGTFLKVIKGKSIFILLCSCAVFFFSSLKYPLKKLNMRCRKCLFVILKIFSYIICFSIFIGSFATVLDEYLQVNMKLFLWKINVSRFLQGVTRTSINMIPYKSLLLPTLTFCSEEPFKTGEYPYLEQDFVANTYKVDDIFHKDTISYLKNSLDFSLHETRSQMFGLCFSVSLGNLKVPYLKLSKKLNIRIFVHPKGTFKFKKTR